jgi:ribonuclease VapC
LKAGGLERRRRNETGPAPSRDIVVEPAAREQAEIARAADRDFGTGGGRPSGLNFGDCFAYALARARREPLLFKGDGFSQTDVAVA